MPITPTSVMQRKPDLLTAEIDGEFVLMSLKDGLYFGLNDIGSDIWKRLAEPIEVRALCAALAADYNGDPALIERDVLELLEKLAARQLLENRPR